MLKRGWIAVTICLLLLAGWVAAQTVYVYSPPYASFSWIGNFTGVGAGAALLSAINDRFSGLVASSPRLQTLTFATLPAERDGWAFYCSDCTATNPTGGSGPGATVHGENGQWNGAPIAGSPNFAGQINPAFYGAIPAGSYYAGALVAGSTTITDVLDAPFTQASVGNTAVFFDALAAPAWASSTVYARHTFLNPALINDPSGYLVVNTVAGTSGMAAPAFCQTPGCQTVENVNTVTAEIKGTGDGSSYIFRGAINNPAAVPGTVIVQVAGVTVGTDDGAGNLTGATLINSKISYGWGRYYFQFTPGNAPAAAASITMSYHDGPAWLTLLDSGLPLVTQITSVTNSSTAIVATAPSFTVPVIDTYGEPYVFGPLADAPIAAAITAAQTNQAMNGAPGASGVVRLPCNALYLTSAPIATINAGLDIGGCGWGPLFSPNATTGLSTGATGSGILCTACSGQPVLRVQQAQRSYIHDLRVMSVEGTGTTYGLEYGPLAGGSESNELDRVMFGGAEFGEPNARQFISDLGYTGTGTNQNNQMDTDRMDSSYLDYAQDVPNGQAGTDVSINTFYKGSVSGFTVMDQLGAVHNASSSWTFLDDYFSGVEGNGWVFLQNVGATGAIFEDCGSETSSRIATYSGSGTAIDSVKFLGKGVYQFNAANVSGDNLLIGAAVGATSEGLQVDLENFQMVTGAPGVWAFDFSKASWGFLRLEPFQDLSGVESISANNIIPAPLMQTDICSGSAGNPGRSVCSRQTYRSADGDTLSLTQSEIPGRLRATGGLFTAQLDFPSVNTCTAGVAGAATCKYKWTACGDTSCSAIGGETTPSFPASCASSAVLGSQKNTITVQPDKGADAYRLYGDDCAGGAYGLLYTISNKDMIPSSGGVLAWTDAAATRGVAPPTVNTTGSANVKGPQQYSNPIIVPIASLPAPCSTPGAGQVNQGLTGYWVNNAASCVWGAIPTATATATGPYPVRCWPDGNYHCSN